MTDEIPFPEFQVADKRIRPKPSSAPLVASVVSVLLLAGLATAYMRRDELTATRTPVESSALKSVGYNSATSVLEIEFSSGEVYEYIDVPQNVASGLMSASSKGRYFNSEIKNHYRYRHIQAIPVIDKPLQPNSMDGTWDSTLSETYSITTKSDGIELQVVHSSQFISGSGVLRFDGTRWSGTFVARFSKDPTTAMRSSQIEIFGVDDTCLGVRTDKIRWDRNGNEISRSPIEFQLRRR